MLNKIHVENAKTYIMNNGRYLEKILFQNIFEEGSAEKVVKAIEMYQNKDGGYGNAIEPDFRLPNSSALATTVALQTLVKYENVPGSLEQIEKAIAYLENTFKSEINGWEDVPKIVNLFPHAPWWHREEPIDFVSGNPSAEIIGYLFKYSDYVKSLDITDLLVHYVERLEAMTNYEFHEILCYIRMYQYVPKEYHARIHKCLKNAYNLLVTTEPEQWDEYLPYPLKFQLANQTLIFPISDKLIEKNLKYFADQIMDKGYILPTWQWSAYEKEWEIAKREWTGILTLEALCLLKNYKYIDTE